MRMLRYISSLFAAAPLAISVTAPAAEVPECPERKPAGVFMLPVPVHEEATTLPMLAIYNWEVGRPPKPPMPVDPGGASDAEIDALVEAWTAEARRLAELWEVLPVVVVVWPDGRIIWSDDRVRGGAPYREATVLTQSLDVLRQELDADSVFTARETMYTWALFGPKTSMAALWSPQHYLAMTSEHPLLEQAAPGYVMAPHRVPLAGRSREEALQEEASPEYLAFRTRWSQVQQRIFDVIPATNERYYPTALEMSFRLETVAVPSPTPTPPPEAP